MPDKPTKAPAEISDEVRSAIRMLGLNDENFAIHLGSKMSTPDETVSQKAVPPPISYEQGLPLYLLKGQNVALVQYPMRNKPTLLAMWPHPLNVDAITTGSLCWNADGTTLCNPRAKLLAYRTVDGPWRVLDASVSTLLHTIDADLEDE